jgi:hypothetical protein
VQAASNSMKWCSRPQRVSLPTALTALQWAEAPGLPRSRWLKLPPHVQTALRGLGY